MATGNPRLAAWYASGDVRLYEFAEGAFVQIGVTGGMQNGVTANSTGFKPGPKMSFPHDSSVFLIHTPYTNGNSRLYSYTGSLIYLSFSNIGTTGGEAGRGLVAFDKSSNTSLLRPDAVAAFLNQVEVDTDGTFSTSPISSPTGTGNVYARCLEISPDGLFMLEGRVAPQISVLFKKVSKNGNFTNWSAPVGIDSDKNVTVADWSPDSRFACFGDGVNGGVEIHEYDGVSGTMKKSHDLPVGVAGLPVSIAFSPDQRMLAIGFNDLGTLNTVTYRRSGAFFIQYATLPGLGALLSFSADGGLLIDSQTRKCQKFDGVDFTDLPASMTNVAAGAIVQTMSTHAVNPLSFGGLYDGVIGKVVNELIDYSNIKLALLTGFASFDPTHTTLAAVNGAGTFSVSSGQYPAAGEPITGVAPVDNGAVFVLTAADVNRIVVDTNLEFRYAVAYDATNDTPLVWFDYTQARTIPKNTELTFTFRGGNLITFAR